MKRSILNSNGYTLVLVLLIITIFTMLAFSFLVQSSNSIKQNSIVEENSNSIALAEMGIMFFEYETRNVYESNHQQVIDKVKSIRETDISNKIYHPDEYYKQLAISEMETILESTLIPVNKTIDNNPSASFSIQTNGELVSRTSDGLKVSFTSAGLEDKTKKTISASLMIDFSNWMNRENQDGNGDEPETNIIIGNEIKDPGNLVDCELENKKANYSDTACQINGSVTYDNNDQLTFDNSVFKVKGALTTGNMNKDIISSTLYVTGSMFTGNMNSLNYLHLFVGGAGVFGHFNGSGLSNSIIEIGGSATIQNMKLEKSKIFIGGSANLGQINDMEDSIIFIDSGADISGVNMGRNSIICVNGPLTIGNINGNYSSKIYAKSSANSQVITDPSSFENACSRGGAQSPISWGSTSITSDYDYQYD